ncbi:MAG: hypothetical protein WAM60_11420 [Candidatus Promineifilaceae bacterium]
MDQLPLYRLFSALRLQANMALGLEDYLLLLEAMQQGHGVGSREELSELCQILWVTSEAERHLFLSVFNELFPITELKTTEPHPSTENGRTQPETESDSKESEQPKPTKEEAADQETATKTQPPPQETVTENKLEKVAGLADPDEIRFFWQHPQPETAEEQGRISSLGLEFLPVTARQMKQSFRHLRQTIREGPRDEVDIERTVEDIARKGLFLEPVMRSRRVNRASLFLLLDQGGSMGPFHPLSRRLADTAQRGSRLQKTMVYYFHNYPADYLYSDPQLVSETAVDAVFNEIKQYRPGVIIVSDGGAARGFYNQERLNWTYYFLLRLRRVARHVTWLNPMPANRWPGTTAAAIETFVPMFALDQQGLQRSVGILRGLKNA